MNKQTEALKLALEALKNITDYELLYKARVAIKEALAEQPAQVDPCTDGSCSCCWTHLDEQPAQQEVDWEKLYRQEVKKKEALAAKYERDTGKKLTRIVPMAEQPAQQQEPVAYASDVEFDDETEIIPAEQKGKLGTAGLRIALYIEPPASKPLTDEEIETAMPSGIYDCLADPWDCGVGDGNEMRSIKKDVLRIARAVEAKLREKNA